MKWSCDFPLYLPESLWCYNIKTVNMKMEQNNCIQCVIVGDGMVGKSYLAKSFVGQSLQEDYIATVFENYAGEDVHCLFDCSLKLMKSANDKN